MKTRKNKLAIYVFAALLLTTGSLQAQVRIGEDTTPTKGAVLDLSSSSSTSGYIGGLKLPNVEIKSLNAIPSSFNEYGSITSYSAKSALAGLLVYNTFEKSSDNIFPGVHYWDGEKWVTLNEDAGITISGSSPIVVNNGSSSSPSINLINGTAPDQILKWNGSAWVLSAASRPFIVSPEITDDYTVTDEDFLSFNIIEPGHILTLPTSGVPVGRMLYYSNIGNKTMKVVPSPRNNTYGIIDAGVSGIIVHLGSGVWEWLSGM